MGQLPQPLPEVGGRKSQVHPCSCRIGLLFWVVCRSDNCHGRVTLALHGYIFGGATIAVMLFCLLFFRGFLRRRPFQHRYFYGCRLFIMRCSLGLWGGNLLIISERTLPKCFSSIQKGDERTFRFLFTAPNLDLQIFAWRIWVEGLSLQLGQENGMPNGILFSLGRGERTQTLRPPIPNRARYQLRHTPIIINLRF